MKAFKFNFPTQKRGDTFEAVTFVMTENGAPFSLAGAIVRCDFRYNNLLVKQLTSVGGSPSILISGNEFVLLPFIANNFPIGVVNFDIQIEKDGTVFTYFEGNITIEDDVTK